MSYIWKEKDVMGNVIEYNPDKGVGVSIVDEFLTIGQQYTITAYTIQNAKAYVRVESCLNMWLPLEHFDMITGTEDE